MKKNIKTPSDKPLSKEKQEKKEKLPIEYILNGIGLLSLSLVPMLGAIALIVFGSQVTSTTLGASIVLITIGILLLLALLTGAIFFGIYYFSDGTKKILKETKYDKIDIDEIFIKCPKCEATLLYDSKICTKCGFKLDYESDSNVNNSKENKKNEIKQLLLKQYNCEISEINIDKMNAYFRENMKSFEYIFTTPEEMSKKLAESQIQRREDIIGKFLHNFQKIIISATIASVAIIFLIAILGKYFI